MASVPNSSEDQIPHGGLDELGGRRRQVSQGSIGSRITDSVVPFGSVDRGTHLLYSDQSSVALAANDPN